MKLPVTVAVTSQSPEGVWRRYADVAFDHIVALGEEVELPFGRGSQASDVFSQAMFPTGDASPELIHLAIDKLEGPTKQNVFVVEPGEPSIARTLTSLGYRRRPGQLMRLKSGLVIDRCIDGLLLLPARAARAAFEAWCVERAVDDPAIGLLPLHLDDPQYDALIALTNGRAIGVAGLQTRGQTGLIADVFVRPEHRLGGVASLLISRVTELAARGQLTDVFAATVGDDEAPQRLLQHVGFVTQRDYVEWLPSPASEGAGTP